MDIYTHANLAKPHVVVLYTKLNNMEWNYLVNPSQADGKHCVYVVLFLTFISLVKGVPAQAQLTHVRTF